MGVDLRSPFALAPADGLRTEFTNYVRGYVGALDYVWCDPSHTLREEAVVAPFVLPCRTAGK